MTKKTISPLFLLVLILALALSACAGQSTSNASASSNASSLASTTSAGSGLLNADYENALPVSLQLVVGTFKLEGTDNEVDAQTAATLLPLWKAASSLSSSDTAATAEVDAVFAQIQEGMTPAQIQAIAAMQLTRADMAGMSEELGLSFGPGEGAFTNMTDEQRAELQSTREAARASGQFTPGQGGFGGGPGGGFDGPPPGMMPGAEGQASGQGNGQRAAGAFGAGMYDAIIKLLESKIN